MLRFPDTGTMPIEALIARWGLFAVMLGAGLEGEAMVVMGGMAVHRELIGFWPAVAAAAAGSFASDQLFFALGRRFREHRFVRRVSERRAFARALAAFERHPTVFVFAFRFLYGLRTVSPVAIGTTALATRRFVLLNAAAACLWGFTFIALGYWFGEAVEEVFGRIRSGVEWAATLALGAGGVALLYALLRRWRRGPSPPDA